MCPGQAHHDIVGNCALAQLHETWQGCHRLAEIAGTALAHLERLHSVARGGADHMHALPHRCHFQPDAKRQRLAALEDDAGDAARLEPGQLRVQLVLSGRQIAEREQAGVAADRLDVDAGVRVGQTKRHAGQPGPVGRRNNAGDSRPVMLRRGRARPQPRQHEGGRHEYT
jgi:hypothetical protein